MSKKDRELEVIEETSKIIEDIEKGFYEILANHTMKLCTAYETELSKYKRAFEILKYEFQLDYEEDEYLCNKKYYLRSDTNILLEKEEAELLEELMKNDN